jgi:hypothetical protein
MPLSTVLYSAHANKETKNSHLITQEGSNFNSQESFGSLGNLIPGKKGNIKKANIDDRKQAQEKEAQRSGAAQAGRTHLENVSNDARCLSAR